MVHYLWKNTALQVTYTRVRKIHYPSLNLKPAIMLWWPFNYYVHTDWGRGSGGHINPNQHKNSHKLRNETRYPVLSLLESQWKLRQQMIRISHGGKAIVEQKLASEEINKSKRAGL